MNSMASQVARLRREARYEEVVSLYQQGMPVLRIAEDLHMSRTTVRKLVAAGAFPERADTLRSKSILDPYVPYLRQRLAEGPTNASHLWRDLREQGFSGGYKVVARWLQDQGWQLRKGRFSQASKLQEDRPCRSLQLRTNRQGTGTTGADSSVQQTHTSQNHWSPLGIWSGSCCASQHA